MCPLWVDESENMPAAPRDAAYAKATELGKRSKAEFQPHSPPQPGVLAQCRNNYATDCNDPDLQRAENMPVQRRSCRENQGVLENCKAFIIARAETHKAESSKR